MRKKLSAGMRKPSPLACACWLMTFFTIACQRVLRWKSKLAHWKKIARQHPDNPVGQFCYWHFSRIARVLRTQKPLYARDLLADKQRRMPLLPALKSYLSLKSPALRNAGRLSVMLSVASLMGTALHLPKSYWILMTVLLVTQNGYGATRLRIVNRSVGTVVGLIIAGVALHFKIPEGYTLTLMLITTPRQLPDIAQKTTAGRRSVLLLPQCIPCNYCG